MSVDLNSNGQSGDMSAFDISLMDIRALLRKMHSATNGWAYIENVLPKRKQYQHVNALAISTKASDGHKLHFFDIRMSRSDWLTTKDTSSWLEPYVEYRWLVMPAGIINAEEVPDGWGLLETAILRNGKPSEFDVTKFRLNVTKHAEKRTAHPIPRNIVAALIRSASDEMDDCAAAINHAQLLQLKASHRNEVREAEARAIRKYEELAARVQRFKEQTGINLLNSYDAPTEATIRIAQAIERFGAAGTSEIMMALDRLAKNLHDNAQMVRKTADEIRVTIQMPAAQPIMIGRQVARTSANQ